MSKKFDKRNNSVYGGNEYPKGKSNRRNMNTTKAMGDLRPISIGPKSKFDELFKMFGVCSIRMNVGNRILEVTPDLVNRCKTSTIVFRSYKICFASGVYGLSKDMKFKNVLLDRDCFRVSDLRDMPKKRQREVVFVSDKHTVTLDIVSVMHEKDGESNSMWFSKTDPNVTNRELHDYDIHMNNIRITGSVNNISPHREQTIENCKIDKCDVGSLEGGILAMTNCKATNTNIGRNVGIIRDSTLTNAVLHAKGESAIELDRTDVFNSSINTRLTHIRESTIKNTEIMGVFIGNQCKIKNCSIDVFGGSSSIDCVYVDCDIKTTEHLIQDDGVFRENPVGMTCGFPIKYGMKTNSIVNHGHRLVISKGLHNTHGKYLQTVLDQHKRDPRGTLVAINALSAVTRLFGLYGSGGMNYEQTVVLWSRVLTCGSEEADFIYSDVIEGVFDV